jgi:hemerythrin superfamily protein
VAEVKSTDDVVAFLKQEHNRIKELFAETLNARDKGKREKAFNELRALLAVHETAEEMVVHPAARRELKSGDKIVDARLEEEHEAKEQLSKIEGMELGSDEFIEALTELQKAVLEHANHEESEEFSKLGRQLDQDDLKKMANAFRAAEAIAPTHPHPGVESPIANFAVGPFASMLDRARDALHAAVR